MNRCFFILVVSFLTVTPVLCQYHGAEHGKWIGPVRSIRVETALLKGKGIDSLEQARQIDEECEYDRVGNLTVRKTYSNGKLILTTRYVYNSSGDLIEETGLETDGVPNYRRVYKYSSQGRLVGETVCRSKPGYFEINPPSGTSIGDPPPPPPPPPPQDGYCEKFRYVYDDKGNVAQKVMYESNHRDPYKEANEYDHEGNLTAVFKHYDILGDKPSLPNSAYKYDANGNLTEEASYAAAILGQQNTKPFRKEVYAYDSEGRAISKSSYDSTGIKEKWNYRYELDSKGNWIKMTESLLVIESGQSHFKPAAVVYRTINYYPGQTGPLHDRSNRRTITKDQPRQRDSPQKVGQCVAVERMSPTYPPLAKAARIAGQVEVEVTVDEQGYVVSAKVLSGHRLLQRAAIAAAWGSVFSPTMVDGSPNSAVCTIRFNFAP